MIDTHVHYSHKRFDNGRMQILAELHGDCVSQSDSPLLKDPKYRLTFALEAAIDPESNRIMRERLGRIPWIFFATGYHPTRVDFCGRRDDSVHALLRECLQEERVIAVGETGLDYHLMGDMIRSFPEIDVKTILDRQELWFRRQIELAYEADLPLVLHVRDADPVDLELIRSAQGGPVLNATDRALQILSEYPYRERSGVIHCFHGDYQTALRYLECGDFVFGIGGSVTYGFDGFEQTVRELSPDRFVLETDAPFVRPAGLPGGRNHSGNLYAVTAQMAAWRGISEEEVIRLCDANAKRVFAFEQP